MESRLYDMHGYTLLFSNDMLYFSVGWNHDYTTCIVTHCCLSNDMLYFSVGWNHDCHDMHGYTLLLVMICCIFQLDGITTVRHVWLHIVVSNDMLYWVQSISYLSRLSC